MADALALDAFRQNRLQMIRCAATGEPTTVTQPAPPRKGFAHDPSKPRRRWGLVPCVPLGADPAHPALPSRHFKTLRTWR